MKKIAIAVCAFALSCGLLVGCSSSEPAEETTEPTTTESTEATTDEADDAADAGTVEVTETGVAMQQMAPADAEANLDNPEYVFVDLRKAADYEAGHVPGAVSADQDAAVNGDYAAGVETMSAAMKDATGSENGGDKKIVLICYSGKKYAQAGTDVLNALGANMDNVYTLEGGMKAWTGTTEA
ncbi:rhodanese-like domain-containing protein [Adlercreutzia sp. ZJ141]|uniref:rhodanese-like domain-containing protein n=1 Tax=Adlercreutzia sp. ZJ141 TaxID=2709406 RepID=UPI0013EA44F1|nr:rhodanese-like domain-containing protein [Adlercreutzia sp. ZJ141]